MGTALIDGMTMNDFRLGLWTVRPELNRISSSTEDIQLEPRLVRVLEMLAARAPDVVSRGELLDVVWHDVIVGEEALTVAISQLRRALDDDARSPRYIETIRKRGYRLLAPVAITAAEEAVEPHAGGPASRSRLIRVAASVVVVIAAVMVAGFIWVSVRSRSEARPDPESRQTSQLLEPAPLTSDPGWERFPAVAPDGERVAYCSKGDIYVTQPGSARSLRLTEHPTPELYPTWSTDGNEVAFIREGPDDVTIEIVSSLGGPSRRVAGIAAWVAGLDWSPDGAWLAVSTTADPELPYLIALVDSATGDVRQLTTPQPEFACDSWPRFSPDGRRVAFVRAGWSVQHELFVIPVDGGVEHRVVGGLGVIRGFDWIDDDTIVLAAAGSGRSRLLRVDLDGGRPVRLPLTAVESAEYPSVGAGSLVFEHTLLDRDVWEVDLGPDRSSRPVIDSTRIDEQAVVSPDGRSIAFVSLRTGEQNLWVCDRDGGNQRPITSLVDSQVRSPGWSPDGEWIGFTAVVDGRPEVHIVAIDGGRPIRLSNSTEANDESFATWSRDGAWIYFGRMNGRVFELWRMAPDGSRRELVASDGERVLADTGTYIVSLRSGPSLWRRDSSGRAEELLAENREIGTWITTAATADTVVVMTRVGGDARLRLIDATTGRSTDGGLVPIVGRFSVAPDARSMLVERDERHERDLMLARLPATTP